MMQQHPMKFKEYNNDQWKKEEYSNILLTIFFKSVENSYYNQ